MRYSVVEVLHLQDQFVIKQEINDSSEILDKYN